MSAQVLRCPSCGDRSDAGGSFSLCEDVTESWSYIVLNSTADGLVTDEGAPGGITRISNPRIQCEGCGHSWPTSRTWTHPR